MVILREYIGNLSLYISTVRGLERWVVDCIIAFIWRGNLCWNPGCSGYMAQPIESQKEV